MSYCTYFYILFISACPTCNHIVRNGCPVGLVLLSHKRDSIYHSPLSILGTTSWMKTVNLVKSTLSYLNHLNDLLCVLHVFLFGSDQSYTDVSQLTHSAGSHLLFFQYPLKLSGRRQIICYLSLWVRNKKSGMCALPLDLRCSLNTCSKDGGGPSVTEVTLHCGCLTRRWTWTLCKSWEEPFFGDLPTSLTGDQLYGNCK